MDSNDVNNNTTVPAKREKWERPQLRRLAASEAEGGTGCYDDGTKMYAGNCGHHALS